MKKILLVDDHPIIRQGLAQLINGKVDLMVCGEAGDASAAMKLFQSERPDAAIVDLSLVSGDGFPLIESMRAMAPEVPVLVLSMHDEAQYAERCLKAGANGYIMKSEPPAKLIEAMYQVLRGGVYLSAKMTQQTIKKLHHGETHAIGNPLEQLSNREFEVFRMMGKGLIPAEIADQLCLSPKTVETYIARIRKKLGIRRGGEIALRAAEWLRSNTPR
ncbi:MAG: response regulator transcription factor [Nitrospirae bacterium]|nr:response regulator transcription factor [Nitrospirota bacterium]